MPFVSVHCRPLPSSAKPGFTLTDYLTKGYVVLSLQNRPTLGAGRAKSGDLRKACGLRPEERPRAVAQSCACRRTMPGKSVPVVPIVNRQSTIDNRQSSMARIRLPKNPAPLSGRRLLSIYRTPGRDCKQKMPRARKSFPDSTRSTPRTQSRPRQGSEHSRPAWKRQRKNPPHRPRTPLGVARSPGRRVGDSRLCFASSLPGFKREHALPLPGFPPRPAIVPPNGPSTMRPQTLNAEQTPAGVAPFQTGVETPGNGRRRSSSGTPEGVARAGQRRPRAIASSMPG